MNGRFCFYVIINETFAVVIRGRQKRQEKKSGHMENEVTLEMKKK